MSVMKRFIEEARVLIERLQTAEKEYSDGVVTATTNPEQLLGSGKFMFVPDGGPAITLAASDDVRGELMQQLIKERINSNVGKMSQLWKGLVHISEEAMVVIMEAEEKAAITTVPVQPQSVVPNVVTASAVIAPAPATVPMAPSRVRRISREG